MNKVVRPQGVQLRLSVKLAPRSRRAEWCAFMLPHKADVALEPESPNPAPAHQSGSMQCAVPLV